MNIVYEQREYIIMRMNNEHTDDSACQPPVIRPAFILRSSSIDDSAGRPALV